MGDTLVHKIVYNAMITAASTGLVMTHATAACDCGWHTGPDTPRDEAEKRVAEHLTRVYNSKEKNDG